MASIQENICALCHALIDIDIVMDHECYDGYTKIHVDDAGYVYPQFDNGTIVDPNEINNQSLTKILWNEMLISEIQKREVLWNFKKFPFTERSIVQKLWKEVVSAMSGNIKNVNEAKIKWKKLCYNYKRILILESKSKKSGSAGRMKKNKWPYYEMMAFIKGLFIKNRKRTSNVSVSNLYDDDTTIQSVTSISSSVSETEAKKKYAPLPPQPEVVLPPLLSMPSQNDEIESMIGLVRAALNRIPLSKRRVYCRITYIFIFTRKVL